MVGKILLSSLRPEPEIPSRSSIHPKAASIIAPLPEPRSDRLVVTVLGTEVALVVDVQRELRQRTGAGPKMGVAASVTTNSDWWQGQSICSVSSS